MDKQIENKKHEQPTKRKVAVIGVSAIAIIFFVLLIMQLTAPKRSVVAYCQVFKDEKVRLSKLPGSTYPSGVFNEEISDASEYEVSFAKLERVAPEEIDPDIATLQAIYKKIHDDPSQAISASLSGLAAESNATNWTKTHCKS